MRGQEFACLRVVDFLTAATYIHREYADRHTYIGRYIRYIPRYMVHTIHKVPRYNTHILPYLVQHKSLSQISLSLSLSLISPSLKTPSSPHHAIPRHQGKSKSIPSLHFLSFPFQFPFPAFPSPGHSSLNSCFSTPLLHSTTHHSTPAKDYKIRRCLTRLSQVSARPRLARRVDYQSNPYVPASYVRGFFCLCLCLL